MVLLALDDHPRWSHEPSLALGYRHRREKGILGAPIRKKYGSILKAKQRKQLLPDRKLSEANLVSYSLLMMISFLHRRELHLQIVVILHGAVDGLPQQLVLFLHSIHLGLQHAQLYIPTTTATQGQINKQIKEKERERERIGMKNLSTI